MDRRLNVVGLALLAVALVLGVPCPRFAAATEPEGRVSSSRIQPHIVRGTPTADYPSVGVLLGFDDDGNLIQTCSGALIGCQTFLTAAHCACTNDARSAAECAESVPARLEVFFQHVGGVGVESVAIDPAFQFASSGDVAVLRLSSSIDGIRPARINAMAKPPFGTRTTVVGFGESERPGPAGIKRSGTVLTALCEGTIPNDAHLCSLPDGNSNSCAGDAGAPLLIDGGDGPQVVGVDSGYFPVAGKQICEPDDRVLSFYSDVSFNLAFIAEEGGADLNKSVCGTLTPVGMPGTDSHSFEDHLDETDAERRYSIDVPAGARTLRIALNMSYELGARLYVKAGAEPTQTIYDCEASTFRACELVGTNGSNLRQRTWHILVSHFTGAGLFQLTATTFGSLPCAGDCNGDGEVTIDELLVMVNAALASGATVACAAGDTNADGEITIDEIIAAVGVALDGCDGA
jgi:hypothetical protein